MTKTSAIWLFDSECALCDFGVQYTLSYECAPAINFVSIQSEEGRAIAIEHGVSPDDPSTFLFIHGGQAFEKSDGVFALINHLKGPVRLLRVGRIVPHFLSDLIYDFVARNRYLIFGRTDACIVPDPSTKHRFVL